MDRHSMAFIRFWWSLTLALVIILMPSRKTDAQMVGYGVAVGPPSNVYWNGSPTVNYPFTSFGSAYPGMGYGGMGYPVTGYGAIGYGGVGYPAFRYGGVGYGPGYAGYYRTGWRNPLFGVGLTPLGTQSYMRETRLFNRVPRGSRYYYPTAYRGR